MADAPALSVENVSYRYGQRVALDRLSLQVEPGQIMALLGPNGSGKSTLFRLISTLLPTQQGAIRVFGYDVGAQAGEVRRHIGAVFQNPALDKQLTVLENLRCHGRLYGLGSLKLKRRIELTLDRLGVADRAGEYVSALSGGLRRRVELAKALLPEPRLLLLDEPSTGLDVSARLEMWQLLEEMRDKLAVTVVLTTHLMAEADRCSQVAIIDGGKLAAAGSPAALRENVRGDVISFSGPNPGALKSVVEEKLKTPVKLIDGTLRIERPQAHLFVPHLIAAVPGMIDSISVGRPTLDDVFVHLTGRRIDRDGEAA